MPYEIEGLTLLDQTTIEAVTAKPVWAILLAVFAFLIGFALLMVALGYWGDPACKKCLVAVCLCVALFTVGLSIPKKIVTPEYIKYSVTIDDNASMNEFFEHYEIVDQHGKIVEIREAK